MYHWQFLTQMRCLNENVTRGELGCCLLQDAEVHWDLLTNGQPFLRRTGHWIVASEPPLLQVFGELSLKPAESIALNIHFRVHAPSSETTNKNESVPLQGHFLLAHGACLINIERLSACMESLRSRCGLDQREFEIARRTDSSRWAEVLREFGAQQSDFVRELEVQDLTMLQTRLAKLAAPALDDICINPVRLVRLAAKEGMVYLAPLEIIREMAQRERGAPEFDLTSDT